MTDGDVAINTHHGKCEDAGEHIVVVYSDDHFAQRIAEGPRAQHVLGALEGEGDGGQGISQGEVEDVDVGGRLHFGVPSGRQREHTQLNVGLDTHIYAVEGLASHISAFK